MTSRLKRQPVKLVLLALCAALVITWGVSVETQAQALYGSVTGRVVDSTGGAIPGAEVTILNPATNFTQTTLSNDVGVFSLPNLPDGSYTLTVSLTGFKNAVSEGVRVEVGTLTRENVVLQVGEITESITVSSAATVLKTDSTDVSAQLDAAEIEDLPMGSFRNYQSLINLVPGATGARFQNAITDTPGRALSTNINGTNRNSNNTRIDGAISVNIWLPHHTAYVPPSETIEVVDISTNNFDAEKGFAGGAATTVITKSGTNEVHGSAWWYHENSALNARDFFNFLDTDGDGKADKPVGRRHMWGGTLGGPIVKDKVFYFVGFEATQQSRGTSATSTVATAAMRQGDFSEFLADGEVIYDPQTGDPTTGEGRTAFPDNKIPLDRMDDASLKMQALLPQANLPGLSNNHEVGGSEVMNRYNTDIKGDWYRTDAHRLWGKFSWMDAQVKNKARFGLGGGGAIGSSGDGVGDTDVKVYGIGQTWTLSPSFLLDTNFGFTDMDQQVLGQDFALGNFGQDVLGLTGTNAAAGQEQACIVDGVNRCGGLPRFNVDGYRTWGQVDGWTPIFRDEDSLTFTQNFSWTMGSHELRFGFDLVRHQMNHWQPEIGAGPRGRFNFARETTSNVDGGGSDRNAWASFLLGQNSWSGKSLQWETMTTNEWQSAFYIRDRFQVTPKLTLTLGLRWEYYPLVSRWDRPMEFMGVNSTIPCDPADESAGPDCRPVVLGNDISVSKKLFAPRLGIAYRLSDNDVFRMGYGVTYSPIPFSRPLRGFYPLTIAGEFPQNNAFVPEFDLQDGIPIFGGPDTAAGSTSPIPSYVDMRTMPADRINRGYIQSWNVMYERKLPAEVVVSAGYVGTQTTRQLADNMLNWAAPNTTGSTINRKEYPIRTTNSRYWDGWLSGNYHSLQIAVNRRFTGGLFIKGAYTWGKAINRTDDEGWSGLMWNDPGLLDRNRGPAGYSRPNTLQVATVYELPFGADGDDFGSKIIRNWQVNGIFSINQNSPNEIGGSSNLNTNANSGTSDQIGEIVKLGGVGAGDPYYSRSSFASITERADGNIPGDTCDNSDGSWDCYGNIGRNMIRGPAWVNLDFSIFRNFAITEGTSLEFRSEFFNLTNTPHFNNPNFSENSSSFMIISGTSSNAPERVVRFALKLKF